MALEIYIYLDNISIIRNARPIPKRFSQVIFKKFKDAVKT